MLIISMSRYSKSESAYTCEGRSRERRAFAKMAKRISKRKLRRTYKSQLKEFLN